MSAVGLALLVWIAGGAAAFAARRRRAAATIGAAAAVVGGAVAMFAAVEAMRSGVPFLWQAAWTLPAGSLALRLDALAAVFLLPVGAIGALCAVYGIAYLDGHAHGTSAGASFAAFNLLLASMALVATANDLLLLLVAWELMTLSSWALVVSDHETPAVRAAGLLYLVAAHLATVALVVLIMVLSSARNTFIISDLASHGAPFGAPAAAGLFLLALAGFGTKAGIVPLHVWLPDAHPAAPSHVSALMSATMITMGFYGLSRFLPLFGDPAAWWGYLLMTLGAAGAIGGILFGTAQRDVKRTLAYSTVENAGIITLAMGVGVLATAQHEPVVAGLAWTAALLHVWNHAVAKALLFLGFGAAAQRVGNRSIDAMGGLLRRWRLTGALIAIGCAAIASLPGLNVFAGEWLLLRALFAGALDQHGVPRIALLGGILALALTGGVAVACFARLTGLTLLGSARTQSAERAAEPGWVMRAPVLVLAVGCVILAAVPERACDALAGAVLSAVPRADVASVGSALQPVALLLPMLAGTLVLLVLVRRAVSRGAVVGRDSTWSCGYPEPTPRMQYSSTSFGEPLTRVFQPLLRTMTRREPHHWSSETPDRILAGTYAPMVAGVRVAGEWIRSLRSPRITRSLLYVVATVLLLVALLFRPGAGR